MTLTHPPFEDTRNLNDRCLPNIETSVRLHGSPDVQPELKDKCEIGYKATVFALVNISGIIWAKLH